MLCLLLLIIAFLGAYLPFAFSTARCSPTISPLSDKGWYALLNPKLKKVGASGIVEYQLNKVIP